MIVIVCVCLLDVTRQQYVVAPDAIAVGDAKRTARNSHRTHERLLCPTRRAVR